MKLEEVLRGPLTADVTEPARSLLALTFEMVAKAIIDLRRVVGFLAVDRQYRCSRKKSRSAGQIGNDRKRPP